MRGDEWPVFGTMRPYPTTLRAMRPRNRMKDYMAPVRHDAIRLRSTGKQGDAMRCDLFCRDDAMRCDSVLQNQGGDAMRCDDFGGAGTDDAMRCD